MTTQIGQPYRPIKIVNQEKSQLSTYHWCCFLSRTVINKYLSLLPHGPSQPHVPFDNGGTAIVCRLGVAVHSAGAFCAHYGSPLARGILAADAHMIRCVDASFFRLTNRKPTAQR
ncbi:hypothetical protein EV401DRAFT_1913852 [Pisolithus croceorrhizus]|nr:hypothetical protein EV401DRAFT_1913852 [Pisolithus croceorrhizus]